MIDFVRRHWIPVCATIALWGCVWLLLSLAMAHNDGHFIYTYDDAYIHLAMARNLAEHGIWGVTQYGFTSSASSLIWPPLLAAGGLLSGSWELVPLALNLILATLLIWVVTSWYAATSPVRSSWRSCCCSCSSSCRCRRWC
jgi:hypothetical protein